MIPFSKKARQGKARRGACNLIWNELRCTAPTCHARSLSTMFGSQTFERQEPVFAWPASPLKPGSLDCPRLLSGTPLECLSSNSAWCLPCRHSQDPIVVFRHAQEGKVVLLLAVLFHQFHTEALLGGIRAGCRASREAVGLEWATGVSCGKHATKIGWGYRRRQMP